MFVLGMLSWLYQRPIESTERCIERPFQEDPTGARRQLESAQGGIELRRDDRDFALQLRGGPGADRAGLLSQHHRQQRNRAGLRRRGESRQASAVPRLLSDYARQRHASRTRGLQKLPRVYLPGRGRDCRHVLLDRRGFRRRDRDHLDLRPWNESQGRGGWPRGQDRTANRHRDIQRAGPSTGMPTKPEQADLLQWRCTGVMANRRFRSSRRQRPGDCFTAAYEAVRIAIRYMTPVILLTDGQLANGAEPWLVPDVRSCRKSRSNSRTDPERLSCPMRAMTRRSRVRGQIPGTPGLQHRVGGITAEHLTGNITYSPLEQRADDPACARAKSPASRARFHPSRFSAMRMAATSVMLGWGSTFGPIREAVKQRARRARSLAYPFALSESAASRPWRQAPAVSRR